MATSDTAKLKKLLESYKQVQLRQDDEKTKQIQNNIKIVKSRIKKGK